VLVQKSVTTITNLAGRLSFWMLGKAAPLGKSTNGNSWQAACYESNGAFTKIACLPVTNLLDSLGQGQFRNILSLIRDVLKAEPRGKHTKLQKKATGQNEAWT
jgi:hypothetical protein